MEYTYLEHLKVLPQMSILETLPLLSRSTTDLLLLCKNDGEFVGTLSDSTIRQAVLDGVSFNEPCLKAADLNPMTASSQISHSEAVHLMNGTTNHLPLVDSKGNLVNLLSCDNLAEEQSLPLTAVIMAGGFGSRLRPLTDNMPKPLLPLGDRPIMELIIGQLRDAGIQNFYVTTHYLSEQIVDHFGDGRAFGVDITYVPEDTPLGTGGALGLLEEQNRPLLVMNGDILTKLDFKAMWSFHRAHRAALTVAVRQYEYQVPYGVMESDGPYLRGLNEKPSYNFLVNAGIYLLEPSILHHIPTGQRFDMTDLMDTLLDNQLSVATFPMIEYWLDIGQCADYEQAQEDMRAGKF